MDGYWIKALGLGAREGRMPDDWRSVGSGLFERAVTFAKRPGVEPGDEMVLYAAGWGAFFARGTVDSYPYEHDEDDRWRWRVDFQIAQSVPYLHDGLPLQMLNVGDRDLRVAIKRRSHIRLTEKEYRRAVEVLAEKAEVLQRRSQSGSR